MKVATRAVTRALRRTSFSFAADGTHAACLASGADGGWYAESWRLPRGGGAAVPTALALPGDRAEDPRAQLVSLPDGGVLVCRHDGERHELVLVSGEPDADARPAPEAEPDGTATEQWLATLRMPGLRLLPLPGPAGASRAAVARSAPVAVALGTDAQPLTTVWLIRTDGSRPEQVAGIPGLHGGGVWLDRVGGLLALDQVSEGVVKTVVLDLRRGEVTPLLEISESSNDRLVLFDPDTHFAMVRSDAPGADRLGWGVLGGNAPLRFPECLHVPGVFLRPIAFQPGARSLDAVRVAVQVDRGAASSLALWQPSGGRLDALPVPPGQLGAVGHWSAAGLRMPYSSPDHPAALATLEVDALLGVGPAGLPSTMPLPLQLAPLGAGLLPGPPGSPGQPHPPGPSGQREPAGPPELPGLLPGPGQEAVRPRRSPGGPRVSRCAPPGWRLDASTPPGDGGRWLPAQSLELAGAAGPLEAVVYGGDAWLSSPHLVLALHGGPADAWRLEFDPTLQRMAAAGLAVVAPNQRGSIGYGLEHALAVRGAWGGPDLDDVLTLLEGISGQRSALGLEPPALFGVSYGAFLALLAAAHAPAAQVARCAVVAPFLSGARLLAEASGPVRALTSRLGGSDPITDARGPRDVLQLAHRLTSPLLVVHGDRDEVVPVSQSRSLRHELLRIGRTEGTDFRYVEAAGAGHELLTEEGAAVLHELLAGFLRTGRPG
ncbi:prolyl oligopeptidase family serine peptidase [Kitasatospora sp. NPDC050543]|uniref:S9 family peptidase n=1 Tax=Kitasatospora sp. NPDC050543 TaxID=3364054 RepID=UPI0037B0EF18